MAIIVAQVHAVAGGAEADDINVTCNVAESRANVMVQASRNTSHARMKCVAHTLSTLAGTSAAKLWHSIALQGRRYSWSWPLPFVSKCGLIGPDTAHSTLSTAYSPFACSWRACSSASSRRRAARFSEASEGHRDGLEI